MAASTNSNQINIAGASSAGEKSISNATVVLLKDESLTLANGDAVDFSNYGNYKALKVTDDSSKVQYIVSLKGHIDVIDFAVRDYANTTFVKYPTYQHSFEYSDSNQPLLDVSEEPGTEDRPNQTFIYDSVFGGSQTRTQRFNDIYQVEISSTWTDQGRYDLVKGARVGDVVNFTMFQNQGVKNKRTGTITQDGRLAELQGDSDIYIYYIKALTMPNDERVDGNKTYTNSHVWSARPGINKLLIAPINSNNKRAFQIFIDAQGFRTGGYENGHNANNFADDYGNIRIDFTDASNTILGTEVINMTPDTEGFDKAGRFLASYVTQFEVLPVAFPIYVQVTANYSYHNGEYSWDAPHYWSEYDAGYGSIGATNPDIMTGELIDDDPWCLDRQYSAECNETMDTDYNPWVTYKFLSDSSGTGGGPTTTVLLTKMYSVGVINKKLQFQTTVDKQFNLITKAGSSGGIRNYYQYKTKKYKVSTQDRPSMVRTISMTYRSYSEISLDIITENGTQVKRITFPASSLVNNVCKPITVTKVVGVRAKSFEIQFTVYGVANDALEINKMSVSYG